MTANDKRSQPERDSTDEGLRLEREKSDHELARTQTSIEAGSDAAIQTARDKADQTSQEDRDNVDVKLTRRGTPAAERESVYRERAHVDAALEEERTASDAKLQAEREEGKRALEALLALERAETDTRLLVERASSDKGIETRDEFLGMVSHDLRSLLAGVALQAALLKRAAAEDEAGRKTVRIVEAHGGRIWAESQLGQGSTFSVTLPGASAA